MGRCYKAHRLAFLSMTGEWPTGEVDHMDGDRLNNRFGNLRDVSHAVNLQNRRNATSRSESGILGVQKNWNKWYAVITTNGQSKNLGGYATPEEASAVYLQAKRRLHEGNTL